jgi:hypothetical protein
MNHLYNFRFYHPYSTSYQPPLDVKAPYHNLSPNATGIQNQSKVWYKMKNGYIYQYTHSFEDDVNYITARNYQAYGSMMNDLIHLYGKK